MSLVIRPATPADAAALVPLVRELNAHQQDPTEFFTLERALADWFGPASDCIVLIADLDGAGVGYAMMVPAYESGWAQRGFYLNDLHVTESARRKGIGRALVASAAAEAKHRGRTYLWWAAKDWNEDARGFYKNLGAIEEPVTAHALVFDTFDNLAREGETS
jgi:GNAT superfamily N-acetyltransferase